MSIPGCGGSSEMVFGGVDGVSRSGRWSSRGRRRARRRSSGGAPGAGRSDARKKKAGVVEAIKARLGPPWVYLQRKEKEKRQARKSRRNSVKAAPRLTRLTGPLKDLT